MHLSPTNPYECTFLSLPLSLTLIRAQVDFLEDFDPGQVSEGGGGDLDLHQDGHHASNGYGDTEGEPSPYTRKPY